MTAIGNVLRRLSFLGVALGIALVVGIAISSVDRVDVDYVSFSGAMNDRQLEAIQANLAGVEATTRDVAVIKRQLDELDWVHHVNVMKDWPSGLLIEVIPEQVIAYWNDDGFINEEGKVLTTEYLIGGDLPHLYGPDGSEYEVMTRYQQLSRTLISSGHAIEALHLNERGGWKFETQNQLQVSLGKEDIRQRVERFLSVASKIEDIRQVDRMDARYINGVAVHFISDGMIENGINVAELNKKTGEQSL
jgi:cell division protein FtsQ